MDKPIDRLRVLVCGFSEAGYPRDETIMAALKLLPFQRLYDLRVTDLYWTKRHLGQTRKSSTEQEAAYRQLRNVVHAMHLQGLVRRIRGAFSRKSRLTKRTRWAGFRIRSLIAARQVDLILVMKWNEAFVLDVCQWARRLHIPVVYDLWVSRYLMAQRDQQNIGQWYHTEQAIIEQCDHLLATTSPYKDFYIETYGCRREKISTLPLAVVDAWLHQRPSRTRPDDDSAFVAGYWGNPSKQHGLDVMLGAAHLLRAEPEIQFWVYGPQKKVMPIVDAEAASNIRLFDFVSDRSSLIGAIDDVDICFGHLLPVHDAHLMLPNKAMEGMARGKVVLHVDSEPMRRLYAECNANQGSVIFFSGGSDELAQAITRLYRHPQLRHVIGDNARQRILADHSVARVRAALQEMIEEL